MHIDSREEGELVDSSITSLALPATGAEHCNYMVHDEMIRYWIIVGYEIQIYQTDCKLIQN